MDFFYFLIQPNFIVSGDSRSIVVEKEGLTLIDST